MQPSINIPFTLFQAPILIVDDNEINRIFIEKTLSSRGFCNLKSVENGHDALDALNDFKPDLVILDILMPGMDGYECCEIIRKRENSSDLPVIIQTSLSAPEERYKAFQKGATDFISKPIFPDELGARVVVHLEKRLYLKRLQSYKSRIESEMQAARQLHYSILPESEDLLKLYRNTQLDIAGYYKPSSEIGGDFWGTKLLFLNQIAIWMADFSGHGMASALNAFRLQAYLMDHSGLATQPGNYLTHLNDKLLQLLMLGQFATMFYGIVDLSRNYLHYATACNPHPIIWRGKAGKAELIDGTGYPLGTGINSYLTKSIVFERSDILLLYSDALIETPNAKGYYFLEEDVMHLLGTHSDAPAEMIIQSIVAAFERHSGNAISDDLTLVVCRHSLPAE